MRAARALFRLRGALETSYGTPLTTHLERLAACAREATSARSAAIVLGDAPRPVAPGLLSVYLAGDDGRVAGHLVLDLDGRTSIHHLELEVVQVCAARAAQALKAEALRQGHEREEQRQAAVLDVVHASLQHLDMEDMLSDAVTALRRGIRCQGVFIWALATSEQVSERRYAASYPTWAVSLADPDHVEVASRAARICWDRQEVSVLNVEHPDAEPLTTAAERDSMFALMRSIEAHSMMMAPMGGAGECQGFITVTRTTSDEPFDQHDEAAVLTIGRELGAAVVHAQALDQQRALVAELQELDAYKNRFVATVAHQLKNPLTSIVGHTEMLSEESVAAVVPGPVGMGGEMSHRSLATIRRGAERIRETVDGLLTLSKVQDAEREIVAGEVRLAQLVEECCDLLAIAAGERGITLDRAGVDTAARAWGDRAELEKVVDNLVGNAVKYSPDGSRVTLSLRSVRSGGSDEVVLECRDDGFGIAPEELRRLFEPFIRSADPRALHVSGTGLGMTIVKAVVDRHHGRIEVESTLDAGSVFRVYLPAAPCVD